MAQAGDIDEDDPSVTLPPRPTPLVAITGAVPLMMRAIQKYVSILIKLRHPHAQLQHLHERNDGSKEALEVVGPYMVSALFARWGLGGGAACVPACLPATHPLTHQHGWVGTGR